MQGAKQWPWGNWDVDSCGLSCWPGTNSPTTRQMWRNWPPAALLLSIPGLLLPAPAFTCNLTLTLKPPGQEEGQELPPEP